jgi:signal transduction histidine kinase
LWFFGPQKGVGMSADLDRAFGQDLEDIADIGMMDSLLSVVCSVTGMGFSAVARVTDTRWLALAVHDEISFGLVPGQELDVDTTLCKEVRAAGAPIVIEDVGSDARYAEHPTPRIYQLKSYISVPIVLSNGDYFGNLCAIDARPAKISEPHIVLLFRLLSQLITAQLESVRRRRQAEQDVGAERENSRLREQFIAVMGHDLRNPLMSIVAGTELLKRFAGDEMKVRATAHRVERSAQRMKSLIDDVQDLSRGRMGGGIALDLQVDHAIGSALEQVVTELRDANPGRTIDAAIHVKRPMRCDRTRMQQLLSNLLANALVHGAAGAPISVVAVDHGAELLVQVKNDGTPIAPEFITSVFGAFTRGETRGATRGLGLGLFICEQVCKAHGGTLRVSSTAEAGTVFTAVLPLDPAASP